MNSKLAFAAILAPFAFAAGIGFFAATATDANACPTTCGMKYKMQCTNGTFVWADSPESLAAACFGGQPPMAGQQPVEHKPRIRIQKDKPVATARITGETTKTVTTTYRGNLIRPRPPVCKFGQKDFTRWADATLEKYGLTITCDKNYGGLNLKPANSGDPTRFNGKLVRWGKLAASHAGPRKGDPRYQVQGIGYYEQGGKLYFVTDQGTAVYSKVWGLTSVN